MHDGISSSLCPFCALDPSRIAASNELAVVILDGFPVSPGHTLIIPRRHIASLFEATEEERAALFSLLGEARELLLQERSPNGFNIGINDGVAAGQTVMHLHIHLIPRYLGDMPDPRGGVRWIFPARAAYWK
ncbi:HIT family protein [Geomonas sp. Red276]